MVTHMGQNGLWLNVRYTHTITISVLHVWKIRSCIWFHKIINQKDVHDWWSWMANHLFSRAMLCCVYIYIFQMCDGNDAAGEAADDGLLARNGRGPHLIFKCWQFSLDEPIGNCRREENVISLGWSVCFKMNLMRFFCFFFTAFFFHIASG